MISVEVSRLSWSVLNPFGLLCLAIAHSTARTQRLAARAVGGFPARTSYYCSRSTPHQLQRRLP